MPVTFYNGTPNTVSLNAPEKKLGGGGVKPRPIEGKLFPIGLVKQAT